MLSPRAAQLAGEIRERLSSLFGIAVGVREIKGSAGHRIYQSRKEGNRHLVDVWSIDALPQVQIMDGVQVLSPPDLIAFKVISYFQRRGKSKSWTDRRDLVLLLLAFPELKRDAGPVTVRLTQAHAGAEIIALWQELAAQELAPETADDDF